MNDLKKQLIEKTKKYMALESKNNIVGHELRDDITLLIASINAIEGKEI